MSERKSRWRMSALTAPAIPMLALLIMGAVGIALLQGDQQTPEALPTPDPDARSYLEALQVSRFDETGAPIYRATAQRATYFTDGSLDLAAVRVDYLAGSQTEASSGRWQLAAPAGRVPPSHDAIRLEGSVDVDGADAQGLPVHFQTPRLTVELDTRMLRTDAPVVLETTRERIRSVGLAANFAGTRIELLDDVKAVVDG